MATVNVYTTPVPTEVKQVEITASIKSVIEAELGYERNHVDVYFFSSVKSPLVDCDPHRVTVHLFGLPAVFSKEKTAGRNRQVSIAVGRFLHKNYFPTMKVMVTTDPSHKDKKHHWHSHESQESAA